MADLCDLVGRLRNWYFAKDRDVTLQVNRYFYLGDGTQVLPSAFVPVGGIILWSGSIVSIPTNWQICDGTNGTPDLRDRFVIGAGSTYAVGATGGAATINIAHTHDVGTIVTASAGSHDHGGDTGSAGSHSHTGSTGSESSHIHNSGTLATEAQGSHSHDAGALITNTPSASTNYGEAPNGPSKATGTHTHDVQGTSGPAGSHTHGVNIGSTAAGSSHSHSIGTQSAHTHTITSAGSHTHTMSGSTASGLSATQSVLNPYYSLAYIRRMA